MSRLLLSSDLHLGHKNIHKHRAGFDTAEEHHEVLFDNLATEVGKRDTLYLLGDVAFDKYWLEKVSGIKCRHKVLIAGNHDTERGIRMADLCETYDGVFSILSKRDYWFTHAPIHPGEMRGRLGNIHGHTHDRLVEGQYINACVEHTNFKPITFEKLIEKFSK